ncbi:beta-galactosidase [Latilactobacillus sakei]|uniref:beta-galactosidase n=1 Tax=Latilactobacillus sakei TaxID=1599 RepID=UPI003F533B43
MSIYFVAEPQFLMGNCGGIGETVMTKITQQYPQQKIIKFKLDRAEPQLFRASNQWDALVNSCQNDDLVLLNFSIVKRAEYLVLIQMVESLRKNGIKVVLCTPIPYRQPESDGSVEEVLTTHLLQKSATATGAYFINLFDFARSYYQYGDQKISDNEQLTNYYILRLRPFLENGSLFEKFYYGAAMYPEVWGLDVIKHDIEIMKSLKMNFTRIGEFMWETLEPEKDVYDFTLLENALKLYQEAGIDVVVGTPTPTPPRWMTYLHPERCVRDINGAIMTHGSRQHICTNNIFYRDRAYQITKQLVKVITKFSNVCGIQLDNEFKCHVDQCFCDSCNTYWHHWLLTEYGTIEELNCTWGTEIWSESYNKFDEVPQPTATPFLHNSSLENAYRRFTAESINSFAEGLCHIIRQETTLPIMHNSSIGFNILNQPLFRELDSVGFDTYAPASIFGGFQMNLDLYRNVKFDGQDFMLLETSTSHAGHIQDYVAPHPKGYMANEVFLGFGAGLKAFNFWHFRQHRFGVEQPHSAVLTAWGEPDSGFKEVSEVGTMLSELNEDLIQSVPVKSKIAIIYSDEAKRFFNIENGGYYQYRALITKLYQSLINRGISVELIQDNADLKQYKVVMVPFIRHISEALLMRLQDFTSQNGQLILGPMTGDRTEELAIHRDNGLGQLGEWLGFKLIRQFSVHPDQYKGISPEEGVNLVDLITSFTPPKSWEILLKDEEGQTLWAKGQVNSAVVTYIGALPEDLLHNNWWIGFIEQNIVTEDLDRKYLKLSPGLVKYRRDSQTKISFYIANMSDKSAEVNLNQEGFTQNGVKIANNKITIEKFNHILLQISK